MECLDGGELSTAASYLTILKASLYSLSFSLVNVGVFRVQGNIYFLSSRPWELFIECLDGGDRSTAASYILIFKANYLSVMMVIHVKKNL